MAILVKPPEGFEERRRARAVAERAVDSLDKGVRVTTGRVSRRVRTTPIEHDPAAFAADLTLLLIDKYKLRDGTIVAGSSFSRACADLRRGVRFYSGYNEDGEPTAYRGSGIYWQLPSGYFRVKDYLEALGFTISKGRGTRSYWAPDKWSAECDVIHAREPE